MSLQIIEKEFEFALQGVGLKMEFKELFYSRVNLLKTNREGLVKSQKNILKLASENSCISDHKLTEKIGIIIISIDRNIEKLKQKELLKRIGRDGGGYWRVKK